MCIRIFFSKKLRHASSYRRVTEQSLWVVFVLFLTIPRITEAQKQQLLGSAHTILIQSDVIYNKDRKFNSEPIPIIYIYQAGLLKAFKEVGSNPDIIVKFRKDVFL